MIPAQNVTAECNTCRLQLARHQYICSSLDARMLCTARTYVLELYFAFQFCLQTRLAAMDTSIASVMLWSMLQSQAIIHAMGSLLQSQTMTYAMLQTVGRVILSAILVRVVGMLQSRLTRAAGHWQQHRASMIQPGNSRLLSRTSTTAAELYYLRHMRSCATTAMGNKGGNPSPSTPLQISGADFIARVLQSIWRHCCLTVFIPLARLLLTLFLPLAGLLQSIGQTRRYYAKIAMKLIMVSFAVLRDTLTWITPLEFAACLHVANAYMHRDLYTCYCESNHCRVSAVTGPSAQETAPIALAVLILGLSLIDWHVPRWLRRHQLLCQSLTAMSMHALRMDCACTAVAFLLPTFGKRPQDQGGASRKRTTATSLGTEQTPGTPAGTEATMQDPGNA